MSTERIFEFKCPIRVVFGINVIEKLFEMVESFNKKGGVLVTDTGLSNSGILDRHTDILRLKN